jgi:probable rRNA maturation factor
VPVTFHTEDILFDLPQKQKHKLWLRVWIESQGLSCGNLSFIYTSNKNIRSINRKYLNHNYFTDVITFDYREGNALSGDIFISVEQVRKNSISYGTKEVDEFRRVMIHGVLHLQGYKDDTEEERARMHQLENDALLLWLEIEGND